MSENQGVKYYKARFIGGPLDGMEKQIACHGGINDCFWTHTTAMAIYDYKQTAKGQFVLFRTVPRSELKAN